MRGAVQLGAPPVWPRPFNPAYDPKAKGRYAAVTASMEADGYYEKNTRAECAVEWRRRYEVAALADHQAFNQAFNPE